MRLRDDELLRLRVETSSGSRVGTVVGFVMDADTGFIVQYRVRPRGIVAACLPGFRELLIAHDQVVAIDAKRMVVRDGATGESSGGGRKRIAPVMSPQPMHAETE